MGTEWCGGQAYADDLIFAVASDCKGSAKAKFEEAKSKMKEVLARASLRRQHTWERR